MYRGWSSLRRGDRVAIYLPMIPEAVVAMLACARIGAPHSVVFGGFSSESLRDRINDANAKLLITADVGHRRGQLVPLKKNADEAVAGCPSIQHVVVVRRDPSTPDTALATQGHGGIEGVYAHQFAHLFFLFSMGSLIYWLRARKLIREPGWRLIQYSALFFILWNLDTLTVHALDDQFSVVQVQSL